ncbi:hypothetical protein SNEBB_009749 [Seison nebaliae]|nr:hypothetical protein SNEBB_009749 [Seison nebaliae]
MESSLKNNLVRWNEDYKKHVLITPLNDRTESFCKKKVISIWETLLYSSKDVQFIFNPFTINKKIENFFDENIFSFIESIVELTKKDLDPKINFRYQLKVCCGIEEFLHISHTVMRERILSYESYFVKFQQGFTSKIFGTFHQMIPSIADRNNVNEMINFLNKFPFYQRWQEIRRIEGTGTISTNWNLFAYLWRRKKRGRNGNLIVFIPKLIDLTNLLYKNILMKFKENFNDFIVNNDGCILVPFNTVKELLKEISIFSNCSTDELMETVIVSIGMCLVKDAWIYPENFIDLLAEDNYETFQQFEFIKIPVEEKYSSRLTTLDHSIICLWRIDNLLLDRHRKLEKELEEFKSYCSTRLRSKDLSAITLRIWSSKRKRLTTRIDNCNQLKEKIGELMYELQTSSMTNRLINTLKFANDTQNSLHSDESQMVSAENVNEILEGYHLNSMEINDGVKLISRLTGEDLKSYYDVDQNNNGPITSNELNVTEDDPNRYCWPLIPSDYPVDNGTFDDTMYEMEKTLES